MLPTFLLHWPIGTECCSTQFWEMLQILRWHSDHHPHFWETTNFTTGIQSKEPSMISYLHADSGLLLQIGVSLHCCNVVMSNVIRWESIYITERWGNARRKQSQKQPTQHHLQKTESITCINNNQLLQQQQPTPATGTTSSRNNNNQLPSYIFMENLVKTHLRRAKANITFAVCGFFFDLFHFCLRFCSV